MNKLMKKTVLLILTIYICSCIDCAIEYDINDYYTHINKAELFICDNNFNQAVEKYKLAFKEIQLPFGKDLFNAALCCQMSNRLSYRNKYLKTIISNSDELEFIQSKFLNVYMTNEEWEQLFSNKQKKYNSSMRNEFREIFNRDQQFRPQYNTHDDTINENRKINIERIQHITDSIGFPSHIELGFTNNLRGQNHDIVLHHTAQRRSRFKSILDLEPMLYKAVSEGRFDPEKAIFYINFQNDPEKGKFEVYSSWQYKHHLLPDSLNNKVWFSKMSELKKLNANKKRKEWMANTIDQIARKSDYLAKTDLPFIFTSVRKSIAEFDVNLDVDSAHEQYEKFTLEMSESIK